MNVCRKEVDGQKAKKNGILKRMTRNKQKNKQNRKNKKFSRQAFWGNKIETKTLKLQEDCLFWLLYKTKTQKHREIKTKTTKIPKHRPKTSFLHFGKQPPIFGNFCFFFKLHSFMSAKLCFVENTIKIVFSAEHSFRYHE